MGTERVDEPALWELARSGDAAAFAALFDRHRDRVFGQALRLMRSLHDAEDVTAVVFLELWRRRKSVHIVNATIVGWLLVATNNVAHNYSRSVRRYKAVIERIPASQEVTDEQFDEVDARIDGTARGRGVNSAFARLSTNDQNVITLCVLEEMTIAEAAASLGVPTGTVKSRLSRAKQRLSVLTTEELGETVIASGGVK